MLLSFAQWIQATAFFTALRGSSYVYPIVLSLHMVGLAFFGGMVLLTDTRMLGWAMRTTPVADMIEQFRIPKRWGLLLIVACGALLAASKAEEYYYNAFFRAKLILLAAAALHQLAFRASVYASPSRLNSAAAKLAASLSLALWTAVACCGRGIGYIEPPLDKIHAALHFVPGLEGTIH